MDDFLWRSDAASVAWVGDIRAYQLMPVGPDISAQFSRSPASMTYSPYTLSTSATNTANQAKYTGFVAPYDGTISSVTISILAGYTGNLKCAFFASNGTAPTTVIQSATAIITNPVLGSNTFNFSPALNVTKGSTYYFGFCSDVTTGSFNVQNSSGTLGLVGTTPTYAAFPASNPTVGGGSFIPLISAAYTVTSNASLVAEPQEDGATSYVYDSTVGHQDFYDLAALPLTPTLILAVNTRGFVAKSDAGTRFSQIQMKSGSATVQTPALALSTNFLWQYRFDSVDPNTSGAWTTPAVNAIQVGPLVQA
jgi:hypothetical protein